MSLTPHRDMRKPYDEALANGWVIIGEKQGRILFRHEFAPRTLQIASTNIRPAQREFDNATTRIRSTAREEAAFNTFWDALPEELLAELDGAQLAELREHVKHDSIEITRLRDQGLDYSQIAQRLIGTVRDAPLPAEVARPPRKSRKAGKPRSLPEPAPEPRRDSFGLLTTTEVPDKDPASTPAEATPAAKQVKPRKTSKAPEEPVAPVLVGTALGSPARHVVSEKPFIAKTSMTEEGGRVYPSRAIIERLWSDGVTDYSCSESDYESPNPKSVATHYGKMHSGGRAENQAHRKNTVYVDPEHTWEPTATQSAALSRLATEIQLALDEGLVEARDIASHITHNRVREARFDKVEGKVLTPEEQIAQIRLVLEQGVDVAAQRLRIQELEQQGIENERLLAAAAEEARMAASNAALAKAAAANQHAELAQRLAEAEGRLGEYQVAAELFGSIGAKAA